MSDRDCCYPPDCTVLRNKLDIQGPAALEVAERELVALRLLESVPAGEFDLDHLKAIHRHLFQDVYAWAGEVRTVEIAKGDSRSQPRRFIAAGMADIHRRIVAAGYFRRSGPDGFAVGASALLGDVNHVHPFRESNGRKQLQYLKAACRARRPRHRPHPYRPRCLAERLASFQRRRSRCHHTLHPTGPRVAAHWSWKDGRAVTFWNQAWVAGQDVAISISRA